MPITPFHFGPGLLIKSVTGKHFSWLAFVLANILIDLEPIGFFLFTGEPVHPYLHTYIGALALGLLFQCKSSLCDNALRNLCRLLDGQSGTVQ